MENGAKRFFQGKLHCTSCLQTPRVKRSLGRLTKLFRLMEVLEVVKTLCHLGVNGKWNMWWNIWMICCILWNKLDPKWAKQPKCWNKEDIARVQFDNFPRLDPVKERMTLVIGIEGIDITTQCATILAPSAHVHTDQWINILHPSAIANTCNILQTSTLCDRPPWDFRA